MREPVLVCVVERLRDRADEAQAFIEVDLVSGADPVVKPDRVLVVRVERCEATRVRFERVGRLDVG